MARANHSSFGVGFGAFGGAGVGSGPPPRAAGGYRVNKAPGGLSEFNPFSHEGQGHYTDPYERAPATSAMSTALAAPAGGASAGGGMFNRRPTGGGVLASAGGVLARQQQQQQQQQQMPRASNFIRDPSPIDTSAGSGLGGGGQHSKLDGAARERVWAPRTSRPGGGGVAASMAAPVAPADAGSANRREQVR